MNKFAWLFCGCILALSACSERQLGPDSGTADSPEIRFGVSEQGSGTKALIEANGLAVSETGELSAMKDKLAVGDTIHFKILRDGEILELDVAIVDTNDVYG